MRKALVSVVLLLAAVGACPGRAAAASCAVSSVHVPLRSLGFNPALDVAGLVLPVTIDAAAGSIMIDFSNFGIRGFNISGVDNDVGFPGEKVFTGTIDGAGIITVPVMAQFGTTFTTPETFVPIAPRLSTGIATTVLPGGEFPSVGVPLDFTTGTMTLDGQSIVDIAPGLNISVVTGLRIACTLDTRPDPKTLPRGASVKKAAGTVRFGATGATPPAGDSIKKLTATVLNGATPLDPGASDLFVALRNADGADVMLVHVAAGTLTAKGKKFSATDTDGTTIVVVTGQKSESGQTADVSGQITVKQSKKGLTITLKENGLDLSTLESGTGSVAVAVGAYAASHPVTIKRTTKKLTFH